MKLIVMAYASAELICEMMAIWLACIRDGMNA
jgi:hypothetical protein